MNDKEPTAEQAVGNLIKEHRDRAHLTQYELALAVGGGKDAVGKWEAGKNLPRMQTLLRVRRILDIPLEKLEEAFGIESASSPQVVDGLGLDEIAQEVIGRIVRSITPGTDAFPPPRPTPGEHDRRAKRSRRDGE